MILYSITLYCCRHGGVAEREFLVFNFPPPQLFIYENFKILVLFILNTPLPHHNPGNATSSSHTCRINFRYKFVFFRDVCRYSTSKLNIKHAHSRWDVKCCSGNASENKYNINRIVVVSKCQVSGILNYNYCFMSSIIIYSRHQFF